MTTLAEVPLSRDRIDAGGGRPELQPTSMRPLISGVLKPWGTLAPDTAAREVNTLHGGRRSGDVIVVTIEPDDVSVRADPRLLHLVLTHPVDNALKYGHPGSEVRVAVTRATGGLRSFRALTTFGVQVNAAFAEK